MTLEYIDMVLIISIITIASIILLPIFSWVLAHRNQGS